MATHQRQRSAGARREAPGFFDFLGGDDDYVPIEEQRILRTVPQSPEDIDEQLEDLKNLKNQGPQNFYGA